MTAPTLDETRREIIELDERIERTRLLRTAPAAAWALFFILALLPPGPGVATLAARATRFWFTLFTGLSLSAVAATWVVAHRHLRRLADARERLLEQMEELRALRDVKGEP